MKRLLLCCFALLVSQAAGGAGFGLEPLPTLAPSTSLSPRLPDPSMRYRGSSGLQYQYDLNRPQDELRYGIDPKAQLRDSMSIDPRRDFDLGMGQRGGDARR